MITRDVCRDAMKRLEIDDLGLDQNDRRLLHKLVKDFGGRPVGVGVPWRPLSTKRPRHWKMCTNPT